MSLTLHQAPSIAALTNPVTLSPLLGSPIDAVRVEPVRGIGFSNAVISHVEVVRRDEDPLRLVLKHVRLRTDWMARRTGDVVGREALLLSEPSLGTVWNIVACPYVAFAVEPGEVGLLMHDLSGLLLPDVREPLTELQENALLATFAGLHAHFWDLRASAVVGLMRPAQYCDLISPAVVDDEVAMSAMPTELRHSIARGWELAMGLLPPAITQHLTRPGAEWEEVWADLPQTFLHGDAKVGNCAIHPDGRVSVFDWALAGAGPCAIDLGWYIAVNAARLTAPKNDIIARYRVLLESALGRRLPDQLWGRLEVAAVVCGARMLLWSKALALEAGRTGAEAEWNWWVERLAAIGRVELA